MATLAIWKARAIGEHRQIDILWDRQAWSGEGYLPGSGPLGKPEDRNILSKWLNETGLPLVSKWWKENYYDQDAIFKHTDGKFNIEASPQRSYGYVYITAVYSDG